MEFIAVTNLFEVLLSKEKPDPYTSSFKTLIKIVKDYKIKSIEFSEFRRYNFTLKENGSHLAFTMDIEAFNPTVDDIMTDLFPSNESNQTKH